MKTFLNNFDLSKKTIFVLGSSGLIGSEIIKNCIDANAKIICLDSKAKLLPKKKGIYFEKFNVENLNKIENFLKKIVKKYGAPNCFINASYPRTKKWSIESIPV